jgi:mannose-6-phosphate isomerase-like protein (cupin superfamily)
MRLGAAFLLLMVGLARPLGCEIHDVLKRAEIERMFARTDRVLVAHERPNYAVVFRVDSGKPGPYEMHKGADEVWFVHQGRASLSLGGESARRHYRLGAGDVVHVPRGTAYQVASETDRFEYVAVRVFPESAPPRPSSAGILARRRMPDVLKRSEIDAIFANSDRNQPLHSARNFTINYVIYSGHSGPWEAHRGCVDVYFVYTGTAVAQLGGEIANPKEETPGEIRGDGVSGARTYNIGPGDIVLIPRNTAHHMDPASAKLGYLLMKVWAE